MDDQEITRLAAACDRRRRSQAPRDDDDEITCDGRRPSQAQGDGCRWSMLPKDVLSEVICRLPLLNDNLRLRFAAVCRHWYTIERQHLPYSLPKLCLALPNGCFFTFKPGCFSVLIPNNRLSRKNYRGASSSQLLIDTKDRNLYSLVNPFTLRKRRLSVPYGIRVHEDDEPAPEELCWSQETPVRKLVVCPDSGLVAAIVGHE
jgi:hypothetical protein